MRGAVAALALTGCTALADFPEDRLAETTDALCGNGIDDDADGLTDCQDWTCLDREVCCTLPSVVLDLLIVLDIMLSVIVLMVSVYILKPVDFDPATTEQALRRAGLAMWGSNRPSIL